MEIRTRDDFELALRFREEMGRDFWIGGSDREIEGEWRWKSNIEPINMYRFWTSGGPSSLNAEEEDCLDIDQPAQICTVDVVLGTISSSQISAFCGL